MARVQSAEGGGGGGGAVASRMAGRGEEKETQDSRKAPDEKHRRLTRGGKVQIVTLPLMCEFAALHYERL